MNEIRLYGTVGATFWDEAHFTASDVGDQLAEMEEGPVTVRINSGGGLAAEGQAIYTLLQESQREVTVVIDGIAASAASLIAMAGDVIRMPLGSQMMIHDPAQWFTEGRGTEADHLRTAKSLSVTANAFAKVYAKTAGISNDAAREIMKAETWLDGDAALEAGFATEVDADSEAAEAAIFDYAMYAKAPRELRDRPPAQPGRSSRAAVMATMMGVSAPRLKKERVMDEEEDQTTTTENGDEEEAATPATEAEAAAPDDEEMATDEDEEMSDDAAASQTASTPPAALIMDLVMATGGTMEQARDYIARDLTLEAASTEMTAALQQETPTMTAPRARVGREDRETRRAGMTAALMYQIGGVGEVDGNARRFMDLTLVEMAAQACGYTGPTRSSQDRIDVFMAAGHSTSDFPAIFENAANKILLDRYETADPVYRRIARRRDFRDFRPTPLIRTGDFPMLQKVNENGEIKFGTFGESKETAALIAYARGIKISRQMLINDDLGAIDEVLSSYGEMIPAFEEATFWEFALSAKLADGKEVFHADHKNLAAVGGDITVDGLTEARAAIRKQTGVDGRKLGLRPSILLVGPERETQAEQIVSPIQPTEAGQVNTFNRGTLTVETTPEITGTEWYLLCGPGRAGSPWVWGYLEGATGPRVRMDEPFGSQGMAMTVEEDFGMGAADSVGGFKNPGS
ncbi:MAG: head maturation protease, ClpP-related [Pseudomonadota bacterium]